MSLIGSLQTLVNKLKPGGRMVIPVGGQTDEYQVQPHMRCRRHRQQHLLIASLHSAACQVMHELRSASPDSCSAPQTASSSSLHLDPRAVLPTKPPDMRLACGQLRCTLQVLQLVDKAEDGSVAITDLMPVRFVPLVPEKQNRQL